MTEPLPSAEVFIATSLDGFIARPDGDIEWLVGRPTPEGEDFGYATFMDGIGALVMGRQSFDKVVDSPEWPYPVPVIVLSRSPAAVRVPEALREKVRVSSAATVELLRDLGRQGVRRVYIDGGQVVRSFLAEGLVRRLIVTLIPVLLGQGRPLWGHGASDIELELVGTRQFANGFVELEYRA